MASKRGNGVTLYDLHGEDVELYDSNTKAVWVDRPMTDRRRIVVTNRPIRNDETVYIKLCGTGGIRLGVTNWSHHGDGDIANFSGNILFKDRIYEKSVKRKIQKAYDDNEHFLVYHDEFGAENKSMQRKLIPLDWDFETLTLFCEISFGDIRVAFETRDGQTMTYVPADANQIIFDDKDAMLTNTTGSVIIPDIEIQIDDPMRICVKANAVSGNFIITYGLTNIPPNETTGDILKAYSTASTQRRGSERDKGFPAWFKTCEVRTHDSNGIFTFCMTKDYEIQTNFNCNCEMTNIVPVVYSYEKEKLVHSGPDLQTPTWLVLECFECDVRVEVEHDLNEPHRTEDDKDICFTFTYVFNNIEAVQYIMDYQHDCIEEELSKVCSKLDWSKESLVAFSHCCTCNEKYICQSEWTEQTYRVFNGFIGRVNIFHRQFEKAVWGKAVEFVDAIEATGIQISKDEGKNEIRIFGFKDDPTLTNLISTLESIKPPVSVAIDILNIEKFQVLEKFGIIAQMERELNVEIILVENVCHVTGYQQNVLNTKAKLLEDIMKIQEYKCGLLNQSFEDLLKTEEFQRKINDQLNRFDIGSLFEWKVKNHQLSVWCKKTDRSEEIAHAILEMVSHRVIHIQGNAYDNRDAIETNISEVQERIKPYAQISFRIDEPGVKISITCLDDFMDTLIDDLTTAVEQYLIKDFVIPLPEYIAKYINDTMMEELELNLKHLNGVHMQYRHNSIYVKCPVNAFDEVKSVVLSVAKQIHMEWVAHSSRGIDTYFREMEGVDLVNLIGSQCMVEMLTQIEMKSNYICAATLFNSGAVIFTIAGDIINPVEVADIVVNQTDPELKHDSDVAQRIAQMGGQEIIEDCSKFRERRHCLEAGEVYISSAGQLPYQKVFHVSIPSDAIENDRGTMMVADTLKNILRTADAIDDGIFRSIALPLLGNVRINPPGELAKVMVEIIKKELEQHHSIRQIFIYDTNPEVCSVVQEEMQRVFIDTCFHLPMQKVDMDKDISQTLTDLHKIRRNCVRKIPLLGNKKLLIRWRDLKSSGEQADVTDHTSSENSNVFEKINRTTIDTERLEEFDLEHKDENELWNGGFEANDIIPQTTTEGLTSTVVFNLKTDPKLDSHDGSRSLRNHVEECLHHAVQTAENSVEFSTFGTGSECNYSKETIAKTLLQTIGEYMMKYSDRSLEEIGVVIDNDDDESTMQFEHEIAQIYSERPHRLEVLVPENKLVHKKVKHDIFATFKVTDSVTLSLTTENIENVTADVIVCTTAARNFPNLKFGAIATSLKRAGGDAIQAEISTKYHHGIPKNKIAYTAAGNLRCEKLFYIPLQDYNSSSDVIKITDFVRRCLSQADKFGHSSICFPSIGTGSFRYPGYDSAKAMFDVIQEYFAEPQTNLKKLVIALTVEDANTVQVFHQFAARTFELINQPEAIFENVCEEEEEKIPSEATQDFVLMQIVSRNKENVEDIKSKIAERIQTESKPLHMDVPPNSEEVLQDKEIMRLLQDLAAGYHVDIEVDFANKQINFIGIRTHRTGCREKLQRLLTEITDEPGNLSSLKQLLQNTEWCYTENTGKLVVPYPRGIAARLYVEDWLDEGDDVEFMDTDGQTYVIDLRQMKEYKLESGQRISAIDVVKYDISSGSLPNFDEWIRPSLSLGNE